jgi:hypothetical protein
MITTGAIAKRTMILSIVACGILTAALHLGLLLHGLYGISADESGRTMDAYTWLCTGSPQSDVWLPFHRIIVGAGLLVWNELFLVPRIISFAFGLLAFGAIVWMAHELFRDRTVTLATAFLSALFPPRIILSVVPLTEIEFIAVLLIGFVFYMRWIRLKNSLQILASALCIGIGTTIRYEGWIVAFVFALLLLLKRDYRTMLFTRSIVGYLVLFLLAVFPLYWTAAAFYETHRLLGFASSHAERYRRAFHIDAMKIVWHNPVTQFLYQNALSLNLIGMLSLVSLFRSDKQKQEFLILPASAMAVFAVVLLTGAGFTTHNPWRISVLWGCLLLPFTAYWMVQHRIRNKNSNVVQRYGILLLAAAAFAAQLAWLSRAPEFTSSDYSTGNYLKQELPHIARQKILIETSQWNYLNILVASNAPDRFVLNTGFDPYEPKDTVLSANAAVDADRLIQKGIKLLVFQSPLTVSQGQMEYVKQQYRNPRWTVYELLPGKEENGGSVQVK